MIGSEESEVMKRCRKLWNFYSSPRDTGMERSVRTEQPGHDERMGKTGNIHRISVGDSRGQKSFWKFSHMYYIYENTNIRITLIWILKIM